MSPQQTKLQLRKSRMFSKFSNIGTASLALTLAVFASSALAGGICKKSCCPKCKTPCVLKIEEGTEEKHCWKIEEKVVCIPRVTFSWQWPFQKKKCKTQCDAGCSKPCCAPPKLARSRTVLRLVKHEYECPTCKYVWEPKECTPCTSAGDALAPVPPQMEGMGEVPNQLNYYEGTAEPPMVVEGTPSIVPPINKP